MPREQWLVGVSPRVLSRAYRGKSLMATGNLLHAIDEHTKALSESREEQNIESIGYIHSFMAETHYRAGDAERTHLSAELTDAAGQGLESRGLVAQSLLVRGYAHLLFGKIEDATRDARACLDVYRQTDRVRCGEAAAFLAECLLAEGDLLNAKVAAEEAISICRRSTRVTYEVVAHGVLARALLRQNGTRALVTVEAELALAAELIERSGARLFLPSLLEWRAEVAGVLGLAEERAQLLQQALAVFGEIGAPLQAKRISTRLGALAP